MKESGTDPGCVSFLIIAPLILIGAGVLIAGLRSAPDALTEDGYSQRTVLLVVGALFLTIGLGSGLFSLLARAGRRVEALEQQELETTHREGAARIEKVEQGKALGNESQLPVLLTLEVVIPGKSPYRTTWDGTVNHVFAGQLRPNEWLRVLVSPSNPKEIHIRWGEAAKVPAHAPC